jgi:hypothetical protein
MRGNGEGKEGSAQEGVGAVEDPSIIWMSYHIRVLRNMSTATLSIPRDDSLLVDRRYGAQSAHQGHVRARGAAARVQSSNRGR